MLSTSRYLNSAGSSAFGPELVDFHHDLIPIIIYIPSDFQSLNFNNASYFCLSIQIFLASTIFGQGDLHVKKIWRVRKFGIQFSSKSYIDSLQLAYKQLDFHAKVMPSINYKASIFNPHDWSWQGKKIWNTGVKLKYRCKISNKLMDSNDIFYTLSLWFRHRMNSKSGRARSKISSDWSIFLSTTALRAVKGSHIWYILRRSWWPNLWTTDSLHRSPFCNTLRAGHNYDQFEMNRRNLDYIQ